MVRYNVIIDVCYGVKRQSNGCPLESAAIPEHVVWPNVKTPGRVEQVKNSKFV